MRWDVGVRFRIASPARARPAGEKDEARREVSAVSAASSDARRESWVAAKLGISRGLGWGVIFAFLWAVVHALGAVMRGLFSSGGGGFA